MAIRRLAVLVWLVMLVELMFARLPNGKAGDWFNEFLESLRQAFGKKTEATQGLPTTGGIESPASDHFVIEVGKQAEEGEDGQ